MTAAFEKARETRRGDVHRDARRVAARPGDGDVVRIGVGGEDLKPAPRRSHRHVLGEHDGDRIRVLTRGAARHPDTDRSITLVRPPTPSQYRERELVECK